MFIKIMTRQSSVPPTDDSDHSDSETPPSPEPRLNKNENETKKNNNKTPEAEENEKKTNDSGNDTSKEKEEEPNMKMEVTEDNLPPKKRKRKLRKVMEPKKRNKTSENNKEKKTGAIIISLYDLLNMTEGPPMPPTNNEKEPAPPDKPFGYHEEPYNYESTTDDYYQMEVEEYLNLEIKNIDDLIKIGEDYIKG